MAPSSEAAHRARLRRERTTSRDRADRGATEGKEPPTRGALQRSSLRSVAPRFPILPGTRTGSARRRGRRGPGSQRTGTTRATRRRTASDSPPPESRRPPLPAERRRRQRPEVGSTGGPPGSWPARAAARRDRVAHSLTLVRSSTFSGGLRPAGPPYTLIRSPLRRLAPFAWLTRYRSFAHRFLRTPRARRFVRQETPAAFRWPPHRTADPTTRSR